MLRVFIVAVVLVSMISCTYQSEPESETTHHPVDGKILPRASARHVVVQADSPAGAVDALRNTITGQEAKIERLRIALREADVDSRARLTAELQREGTVLEDLKRRLGEEVSEEGQTGLPATKPTDSPDEMNNSDADILRSSFPGQDAAIQNGIDVLLVLNSTSTHSYRELHIGESVAFVGRAAHKGRPGSLTVDGWLVDVEFVSGEYEHPGGVDWTACVLGELKKVDTHNKVIYVLCTPEKWRVVEQS